MNGYLIPLLAGLLILARCALVVAAARLRDDLKEIDGLVERRLAPYDTNEERDATHGNQD